MQRHIAESHFGRTSACAPTIAILFSTSRRCSKRGLHRRSIGSSLPLNNCTIFAQRTTSRLNWPKFTPIAKLLGSGDVQDSREAYYKLGKSPSTKLCNTSSIGCKPDCDDYSCASAEDRQLTIFSDGPLANGCVCRLTDQKKVAGQDRRQSGHDCYRNWKPGSSHWRLLVTGHLAKYD